MSCKITVGIDLGTGTIKCAVRKGDAMPVLVHNEASEIQTAPCVSIKTAENNDVIGRVIGSSAVSLAATRPTQTVSSATGHALLRSEDTLNVGNVDGNTVSLRGEQTLAMVLSRVLAFASKKEASEKNDDGDGSSNNNNDVDDGNNESGDEAPFVVCAVPPWASVDAVAAVNRALAIAGVPAEKRKIVPSHHALFASHASKHGADIKSGLTPADGDDACNVNSVSFVDIGACGLYCASANISAKKSPTDEESGEVLAYEAVAVEGASDVAGEHIDELLVKHIAGVLESNHGVSSDAFAKNARLAFRVKRAAERAKKTLSTIPQTKVDVENVGDDKDASFTVTRDTLERSCCAETVEAASKAVAAVVAAGKSKAIEVVGGTTRVPSVIAAVKKSCAVEARFTLDSTAAIAYGAALLADESGAPCIISDATETVAAWKDVIAKDEPVEDELKLEAHLAALDEDEKRAHAARNSLESIVLETRSAKNGADGSLIPDSVMSLLNEAEEWLCDMDNENARAEEVEKVLADYRAKVEEGAKAYFDKVQADRERVEEEIRKEAEEAPKDDKDDHDFRKLKFPDRMRLVMLNKDEGTTLFKDGNIAHAASRYVKSLQHADKFVGDLTEEQQAEIKKVKLSLYLNTAQCFIKLDMIPKAMGNLDEALRIDPENVKALFRRASCFEATHDLDRAEADVKAALKVAPEEAAVLALSKRIDARRKRDLAKKKKTYAKMFG